ncbi:MAG: mechanosensitive ion channel family protein [Nitrososphaerota archaeon]|nr:mechanosensitive ion channel family protein [Nitrososphaerota archaeon]MDG7023469.1 mechanosensitive ion channel family protein [Nitrososphaerota archaeon]
MNYSSFRRLFLLIGIIVAVLVVLVALARIPAYSWLLTYSYAVVILLGGVLITRQIARIVAGSLHGHSEKTSLEAKNAITIIGYIVSAVAVMSYLSFSPTELFATATFSGLVLGLAMQPTLGSFFAGILILASGTIRPGNQVRVMTWHIPFLWASSPGYKYFSPDQVYAGYMAEVLEIGLFFTTVLTEEGQTIRIPNTIIATDAAVVTYTNSDYIFNVRYEFSNEYDPNLVLRRVREEVSGYPVINCFINEQSDKNYYIVKVVLNAKEKDHAVMKSEILARLINLNRSLDAQVGVAAK